MDLIIDDFEVGGPIVELRGAQFESGAEFDEAFFEAVNTVLDETKLRGDKLIRIGVFTDCDQVNFTIPSRVVQLMALHDAVATLSVYVEPNWRHTLGEEG